MQRVELVKMFGDLAIPGRQNKVCDIDPALKIQPLPELLYEQSNRTEPVDKNYPKV
jgi:hypothetical protein